MKFCGGHKHHLRTDKTGIGSLEEGTAAENYLQAVWPMLVFVVVYPILLWMMEQGLQYVNQMLQAGDVPVHILVFQYAHAADYQALFAAVGMCITLLIVVRLCCRPGEIGFTRHMGASWQKLFLTACSILCGAVALNLLITQSVTGGILGGNGALREAMDSTAAGVENMQRQNGTVTLWVGIAVYGFLTPLAEECIFRGITLRRLYKVFLWRVHSRNGSGAAKPKESFPDKEASEERNAWLLAAAISSLFFGMYHGNPVQGIYAACMGFAFCRMLKLSENLGVVVLLHGAINAVVLLMEQSGNWNGNHLVPLLSVLVGVAICSGAAAYRWKST